MIDFIKKHKNKIIASVAVIVVLAFAFWYGGSAPNSRGWSINDSSKVTTSSADSSYIDDNSSLVSTSDDSSDLSQLDSTANSKNDSSIKDKDSSSEKEKNTESEDNPFDQNSENNNDNVSENNNHEDVGESDQNHAENTTTSVTTKKTADTQSAPKENKQKTCTISILCNTLLDNWDSVNDDIKDFVPENGVILSKRTVNFNDGDTVFDVLKNSCQDNNIHLEFEFTPLYNSIYIEGISNIYEFDAGSLSGWLYSVNDDFPSYSSSKYTINDGDDINFVYTCDLGKDVGGENSGQWG